MSKELEAFNRVIDNIPIMEMEEKSNYTLEDLSNDTNLIRQALTELQAIKNANPSKVLECLEKVKGYRTGGVNSVEVYLEETEEYNTIKQTLLKAQKQGKALKIIKKKYVHIPQLLCAFENQLELKNPLASYYNGQVGINVPMPLTEEEFDLLREVLWNAR